MSEQTLQLVVDSVPYILKVVPFAFNEETRFRVSYNGSTEYIFTWDSSIGRLAAIDDDAASLPYNIEVAIAEKLQSGKY
jgi:hypothetical protein